MVQSSIHDRVTRFAQTLSIALFDRSLELAGEPIHYFYDADVVLRMILGFELDLMERSRVSDSRTRLVRSLLSCHFLGPLRMLRPHALELDSKLKRQPSYRSPRDQDAFALRTRQYLRDKGIEQVMAELQRILATDARERVSEFLAVLRANAGETFSAIEFVNGPWMKRLRRFWDTGLLVFEELGPEMSEIFESRRETIDVIRSIFAEESSTRRLMSDLHDSVALAILISLIDAREHGGSAAIVRFYTETPMLLNAWKHSSRLRSLLTYKYPFAGGMDVPRDADFVVRTADYFLMRAIFPPLAPHSRDGDLASLRWLSSSLDELLGSNPENLSESIRHINWEGRSPLDVINDFEDLTLTKSVWADGKLPGAFLESLPEWVEVFEFAQGRMAGEKLFSQIDDIQRELEAKVFRIRAWNRDFEMLVQACKAAPRRIRGSLEDPLRDLGLVRWGYTLPEHEKENLVLIIKAILAGDESELSSECAGLACRMEEARKDVLQCLIVCAVLWALNRFGEIVALVRECGESISELPASLVVFQMAAQLKAGIVQGSAEREQLVDRAWALKESLGEEDRRGILLGVAYVLYHAWKQETVGLALLKRRLPGAVQDWAQKSFEAGEMAVQTLSTSDLAWAFAVNHCAYVGIMTGLEEAKTAPYLYELSRLQAFPSLWNSRFDDTLGFDLLLRLEAEALRPAGERRQEFIEKTLEAAARYFDRARTTDFGDIDLDEHIDRLERVRAASGRRGSSLRTSRPASPADNEGDGQADQEHVHQETGEDDPRPEREVEGSG